MCLLRLRFSPMLGKYGLVESKSTCSVLERKMTGCQRSPTATQGSYLLRRRMQVSCTACLSLQGRTGTLLCPDSKGDSQPQTINQEGKGNRLLSGVRAGRMVSLHQVARPRHRGLAVSSHSLGWEDRETCRGIHLSYTKSKAHL